MEKYGEQTDEQLILAYRQGDEAAMDFLLEKYKNFVRKKAHTMFMLGGDSDDLIQEGMIGLYKAIRDYQEEKKASFLTFADLCISRQIFTAIEASKRQKHAPLNSYVSIPEESEISMQSFSELNPEDLIIDQENVEKLTKVIEDSLSSFEKEVLNLYLAGHSHMEIGELVNKAPKSVNNALSRVKQKIRERMKKV